jgi:4-amino-4-deoxy-L-arabinose transferase-like glycosyltransferase
VASGNPGVALALLTLAIHLWASGGYGYFRDELYFIVCGRNPAWGYVDQPPLVPLIAAAMDRLFAPSLVMLRLVPALAHAATVALAAETARLLGGRVWAQALAALCVLSAGVFLATGTILSTDALQPLSWLFCGYALIRLIRGGDQRWWFALGVVAGIALLSKYMLAFWLAALGIGLVATPARRCLARREPWIGATVALAIVLPNIIWQAAHGWPFLEIGRVAATTKNVALSPLDYMQAEIWELGPANAPIWIAGLAAFAFWRRFADLRGFAIACMVLIAAMISMHGKPYYPAGAYPLLFAGGAVALEAWIGRRPARTAIAAVVMLVGVIGAPFALPILPVEMFAAYQSRLGLVPKSLDHSPVGRLPQLFADMFGWPELAALVGRTYQSLPPDDQSRAVFFANNYGEAAAIDVLGAPWHLPPAISTHNNYFLWGPRGHDGSVLIRLGGSREQLLRVYQSVESAGVFDDPWAMPYETGRTVWICRGRNRPLAVDWASLRNFN